MDEMLTGQSPFVGISNIDVIAEILKSEVSSEANLEHVQPELSNVISRALAKDSFIRFKSAKEFESALEGITVDSQFDLLPARRPRPRSTTEVVDDVNNSLPISGHRRMNPRTVKILGSAILALGLVALLALRFNRSLFPNHQRAEDQLTVTKLTDNGDIMDAIVSPDGKYLASVRLQAGSQALWLTEIASKKEIQLVAPAEQEYWGIVFSHRGDKIYYNIKKKNTTIGELSYVDLAGGPSHLISQNVDSPATISPDDSQIAFVRRYPSTAKDVLVVIGSEGGAERELVSRAHPN